MGGWVMPLVASVPELLAVNVYVPATSMLQPANWATPATAAFGFAVHHVIQGSHPTDATCRRFVDDLVAHYDVAKPNPSRSKRTRSPKR